MRTLIIAALLIAASSARSGSVITFPQPIQVTTTVRAVELAPVTFDYATGIYQVIATYNRNVSEITTNGVTVAARSQVHVQVAVTPAEQVAWLQTNGMPDITADAYPVTPIAPAIKTQMITAIAMQKALPAILAALQDPEAGND